MQPDLIDRENQWVPISKHKSSFSIKKTYNHALSEYSFHLYWHGFVQFTKCKVVAYTVVL